MRSKRSGFALFLTLVMATLMVMLLTATIFSTHGGSVFSQDYHGKKSAYYAAESGLAILQERLSNDPTYDSNSTEATPFGNGTFTIRFASDACINNMLGSDPVPGPHGDIPAGSTFVKITGEALGHSETIECILGRRPADNIPDAVVVSGKIYLEGDISISGRDSNDDLTSIPADVISNYRQSTWTNHRPVHYDQGPTDTARVEGVVRSASPNPAAISPDLAAAADRALTDEAPVPTENYDIQAIVRSKSALPNPPTGTVSLTGEYYSSSDYLSPGDLELQDAELYIRGDLTVIGSIKGRGSIYVTGNTVFSGDSLVRAQEDGIALYSYGNVSLTGFSGTAYMDAIVAASSSTEDHIAWDQTKGMLEDMVTKLDSGDPSHFDFPAGTPAGDFVYRNYVGITLSHLGTTTNPSFAPHPLYGANTRTNHLERLVYLLQAQPMSEPRDFLIEKFTALRIPGTAPGEDTYGVLGVIGGADPVEEAQKAREFIADGTLHSGTFQKLIAVKAGRQAGLHSLFDFGGLTDAEVDQAITKMTNWFKDLNHDKLGTSFFQGAIYTRGAFYADNEVTVIGSIAVVADPNASSTTTFSPKSGVDLSPGDLYLGNGTNITYVSDLIPGSEPDGPRVGVTFWIR